MNIFPLHSRPKVKSHVVVVVSVPVKKNEKRAHTKQRT